MKQRGNETPRRENISSDRCSSLNVPWLATCLTTVRHRASIMKYIAEYIQELYIALLTKLGSSTIRGNVRSRNRYVAHKIEFVQSVLDESL